MYRPAMRAQIIAPRRGRIQQQLIPFEDQQRLGRRPRRFRSLNQAVRRDARVDLQIHAELSHPGRNLQVKGIEIHRITAPRQRLSIGLEYRGGE
jgi:hypothetical protein